MVFILAKTVIIWLVCGVYRCYDVIVMACFTCFNYLHLTCFLLLLLLLLINKVFICAGCLAFPNVGLLPWARYIQRGTKRKSYEHQH